MNCNVQTISLICIMWSQNIKPVFGRNCNIKFNYLYNFNYIYKRLIWLFCKNLKLLNTTGKSMIFSKRVKFFLCTPGFNFCIHLDSRGVKKVYFKENAVICEGFLAISVVYSISHPSILFHTLFPLNLKYFLPFILCWWYQFLFHMKNGEVRRELFYAPASASRHPSASIDLVPYNQQTKEEPMLLSKASLSLHGNHVLPPEGHGSSTFSLCLFHNQSY